MSEPEGAIWFIDRFIQLWERNPEATCLGSAIAIVLIVKIPWGKMAGKAMFWRKSNTTIQEQVKDGVVNINEPKGDVNITQHIHNAVPPRSEETENGE